MGDFLVLTPTVLYNVLVCIISGKHNDNDFQRKLNSNLTGSYKGRVKVILN